ncbi:putative ATP-grasp superfamily ATP-dependent carboligase [Amycolatopsis echigonensis]|uniref:ATP-grasp superfamily ATP-dependent carboligase n=1 Tax=Amycolatopsis echigonensis TaxID=2576905 RepID=A0A2N3WPG6_9PSEU|nr:carboxylate--amine ligase [Amycolatopsis niigatensis]PKV95750.1 putative ATP-grasp superfamily ATP-dependent carboligase [Amycolatopsis niigatensis]
MRRQPNSPPDVDRATPALVLKLDANVFHHGGLGVIRSLGRLGVPVYAVQEERFTPAGASRYLSGGWRWRPGTEDAARVLAGLLRISERIGKRAVLLPTDDAGALFVAEYQAKLREAFLFPEPDPGLPALLADKYSLHEICLRLGVPTPATALARSWDEAEAFCAAHGFPVIAKLVRPWRPSGAGRTRSTNLVRTREELRGLMERAELMLQEYLPGGAEADWFFHGYCDEHSVCRPAFTGRKHRSYPAGAGLTAFGTAEPNAELSDAVQTMLERLSYRGIMDLDLRRDPRDGRYQLLDFNPRLGAQFRLFVDDAGVDVAVAAHLHLTGREIPVGNPVRRGFLVENYDPFAALGSWRRGQLRPGDWLRSLREVDELAWFARDDLAPFGLMCARLAWRILRRPFPAAHRPDEPTPRHRRGRAAAQHRKGNR